MLRSDLIRLIRQRKSCLCVGLDTDLTKIPAFLLQEEDPAFAFNRQIIDATRDLCVAYKPNTAFYEARGAKGWESLQRTIAYIGATHFIIADAKRGDIGNTAEQYAAAFFEELGCDAITLSPYMGRDSIEPFLRLEGKWAIALGLTSNAGAEDFQLLPNADGIPLYEQVIRRLQSIGSPDNLMFVIGATQAEYIKAIRQVAPQHFYLVPGVGTQGGDLAAVLEAGLNPDVGLLINASRSILYAANDHSFAQAARQAAVDLQTEMKVYC